MVVSYQPPDIAERVIEIGNPLNLGTYLDGISVIGAEDYTVNVLVDGAVLATYQNGEDPGGLDLSAGLHDITVQITNNETGITVEQGIPHIAVVDRLGAPVDPNFPTTGVNLSYPPIEGFSRVIEQANYYENNVDGNIAIRFYFDNYANNVPDYEKLIDEIPDHVPIVLIAPNTPNTSEGIDRLSSFIFKYRDRIAFVESGNEPNIFGPFESEEVFRAMKADFVATKLADSEIPVLFPSMTE